MRLTGVVPPIVTPLTPDGEVDAASLEAVVEHQLTAGVDGIFALGSTGEAAYLRDEDRRTVVDVVVGAVAGAVPVVVGAVDTTTRRVIDQAGWIARAGADVLVVTAPFYANVSAGETLTHFRTVAAAASLPVLAYDIPVNVGRKLDAAISIELLLEGTVIGLKDSSGDTEQFAQVLAAVGPDRTTTILTGADAGAYAALEAGADGVVPGIGNLVPELMVELVAAYRAGDHARAADVQARVARLAALFRLADQDGVGRHAGELGGLKTALVDAGIIASARLSTPMSPYPEAARGRLRELLAEIAVRAAD